MTPRFKIGDTISDGRVQYTVLGIETNQFGELCYIFKNPIRDNNFKWVTQEVDRMFDFIQNTPDSFDWQSFRAETAKDILCYMIQGGYAENRIEYQPKLAPYIIANQSKLAVEYADSLIKQLKEKEKE